MPRVLERVSGEPNIRRPSLLVSYVHLSNFMTYYHLYKSKVWALDSGAFTASRSNIVIDLQKYIDCCKELMTDKGLSEIFALDVIGDWRASQKNVEEMWRQGIPAIPTFHYGEPWSLLKDMAQQYPKIAIGGCVGKRDKDKFAGQCFARVWPKMLHGFGFGSEKSLMSFPWHSVDSTNWELGPTAYARWASFGKLSIRKNRHNLKPEVEWYLDLEERAQERWKLEMVKLGNDTRGPTVYLGVGWVRKESIKSLNRD